jgi:enoyl-CoA hydratase/carnithine racemase
VPHVEPATRASVVTIALADALARALDEAANDNDARVIVTAGSGDRAFSSGYDIREMAELDAQGMLDATLRLCPVIRAIASRSLPRSTT